MELHFSRLTFRIHSSFALGLCVVLGALGAAGMVTLTERIVELCAVVLAREVGSVILAWILKARPRVLLCWWGADTTTSRPLSVGRRLLLLLAGPLGLFAFGEAARALGLHQLSLYARAWALLSLMPIQPLPGGRMAEALFSPTYSYVMSLAMVLLGFAGLAQLQAPPAPYLLLAIALVANLGFLLDVYRRRREPASAKAWQAIAGRERELARALIDELKKSVRSTAGRADLNKLEAWLQLLSGHPDQAQAWIDRLPAGHDPDDVLVGAIQLRCGKLSQARLTLAHALEDHPSDGNAAQLASALAQLGRVDEAARLADHRVAGPKTLHHIMSAMFYAGRFDEAARIGERSWSMEARPLTAFNLACTRTRLNDPDAAFAWLQRALDAGWRDLKQLDEDPDLAPLRSRPDWTALRARLTSLGRVVG